MDASPVCGKCHRVFDELTGMPLERFEGVKLITPSKDVCKPCVRSEIDDWAANGDAF